MKNNLYRLVTLVTFMGLFAFGAFGQAAYSDAQMRALIAEDYTRMGNLHHRYEVPTIYNTPAPRGYKPFYISHYGRHGCRYQNSLSVYDNAVIPVLDSLGNAGLLTPLGRELLADIKSIRNAHEGMEGMLTQRGAKTHRGISGRMLGRFKPVFRQRDAQRVRCASTPVPRCIMSMSNFLIPIQRAYENMEISMDTGERYRDYLVHPNENGPHAEQGFEMAFDSFAGAVDARAMAARFLVGGDCGLSAEFFYYVMYSLDISQCLDGEFADMRKYFSDEDIYAFYWANDIRAYNVLGRSLENGGYRPDLIGKALLKDIVAKADEAASGGEVCADLRFGHDSGLAPLMFFIRAEGFDMDISSKDAPLRWPAFRYMPMASNVQFVFYRNRDGNVLVKMLFNEVETGIPALEAVSGVYYEWSALREYFMGLLD